MRDGHSQPPCASSQIVTLALPECCSCLGCRGPAVGVDLSPAALAKGLVSIGAEGIAAAAGQPLWGWWLQAGQAIAAPLLASCCGGVRHWGGKR